MSPETFEAAEPGVARERWLLSYVDLLTLLLALFVVLFASAYSQRAQAKPATKVRPEQSREPELAQVKKQIEDTLAAEIKAGEVEAKIEPRGLVVRLGETSCFRSADDAIRTEYLPVLEKIGSAVEHLPNSIVVEGHADAEAIHSPRFRDNWELSAARGVSVIRFLTNFVGIPVSRVSATAFADTQPIAANDSEAGRARNRRVDLVLLNSPSAR